MTQETQTFGYRGSDHWDVLGRCKEQSKGSDPELIIVGEKSQRSLSKTGEQSVERYSCCVVVSPRANICINVYSSKAV